MQDSARENLNRITHIWEAIQQIRSFLVGIDEKAFLENRMLQDAILFQFSVIGEAVRYIDQSILEKYPYPWHRVRSFRNFIAH